MDAIERAKTAFYDYERELYGKYGHDYTKLPNDDPRIVELQTLMNCWCGLLRKENNKQKTRRKGNEQYWDSLGMVDECIKQGRFERPKSANSASHIRPLADNEYLRGLTVLRQGGSVSALGRAINRDAVTTLHTLTRGEFRMEDVKEWRWLMTHRYRVTNGETVRYANSQMKSQSITGLTYKETKEVVKNRTECKGWTITLTNHENITDDERKCINL
ncbi:hypothetical protein ACI3E1_06155 [Ligilactobacillus sp. LYQ139]|uniref:hypothetical protein n=1 Tax=Ligilactobacillus sp. LYQ139 TaxID=3378800 RepID=UPI003853B49F